jgi:hypothetical protein
MPTCQVHHARLVSMHVPRFCELAAGRWRVCGAKLPVRNAEFRRNSLITAIGRLCAPVSDALRLPPPPSLSHTHTPAAGDDVSHAQQQRHQPQQRRRRAVALIPLARLGDHAVQP